MTRPRRCARSPRISKETSGLRVQDRRALTDTASEAAETAIHADAVTPRDAETETASATTTAADMTSAGTAQTSVTAVIDAIANVTTAETTAKIVIAVTEATEAVIVAARTTGETEERSADGSNSLPLK